MKLRRCEVVQQLQYLSIEKIEEVISSKKCIKEYAYIIHDKDTDEKGELKEPHIHLALRFDNGYDTKHISQWFGITENYISKLKGEWIDLLKYLIHKNAEDKYQYLEEEVVSNFNYSEEIKKEKKVGRPKKEKDKRKEEIINLIAEGEIREFNYNDYITPVEYTKYSKAIKDAFTYRKDKLIMQGAEREMECIFITGKPGTGKTTYAKKICKDKGLSYYVSSSTNDILDGYKGQDVLILDDLRPQSMELVDLLKLLDNNTNSLVKSRFKNKFIECKMIIITTVLNVEHFYIDIKGSEFEPIEQFKRRCKTYVTLDEDYMYIRPYDAKIKDYGKTYKIDNPVKLEVYSSLKNDQELIYDSIMTLGLSYEDLGIKEDLI